MKRWGDIVPVDENMRKWWTAESTHAERDVIGVFADTQTRRDWIVNSFNHHDFQTPEPICLPVVLSKFALPSRSTMRRQIYYPVRCPRPWSSLRCLRPVLRDLPALPDCCGRRSTACHLCALSACQCPSLTLSEWCRLVTAWHSHDGCMTYLGYRIDDVWCLQRLAHSKLWQLRSSSEDLTDPVWAVY